MSITEEPCVLLSCEYICDLLGEVRTEVIVNKVLFFFSNHKCSSDKIVKLSLLICTMTRVKWFANQAISYWYDQLIFPVIQNIEEVETIFSFLDQFDIESVCPNLILD